LKLTLLNGSVVWSVKGLSDHEEYDVETGKIETEQNRSDAIAVLSKRLAKKVYAHITEVF